MQRRRRRPSFDGLSRRRGVAIPTTVTPTLFRERERGASPVALAAVQHGPYFGLCSATVRTLPHADPSRARHYRRSSPSEPHRHGAADAEPVERIGPGSERFDARLLRATRQCGYDHFRGDLGDADGGRVSPYSGRLVTGASRRLAANHRRRTQGRRPDAAAIVACRTHLRPELSRRRASRCAQRDRGEGTCEPVAPGASLRGAASAGDRRVAGRGGGVS